MSSHRVKALVRRLLGEETMGFLEYRLFPERRERWHGPFNEQLERERLVRALLRLKPDVIVETGTFRGRSTAFFARNGGYTVITVELNARSFGFSMARLRRFKNV
ncbi:MAG: class I SAM-dependent methyltransferase [Planctomycetota bacterium]|jgi:predicted O-methyltransferase YrrM